MVIGWTTGFYKNFNRMQDFFIEMSTSKCSKNSPICLSSANINLNTKMNSVRKLKVKQKQDIIVKTP